MGILNAAEKKKLIWLYEGNTDYDGGYGYGTNYEDENERQADELFLFFIKQ